MFVVQSALICSVFLRTTTVGTNGIGPEQKAAEDTVKRSHYKIARRERKSEGICDPGGCPPEERGRLGGRGGYSEHIFIKKVREREGREKEGRRLW